MLSVLKQFVFEMGRVAGKPWGLAIADSLGCGERKWCRETQFQKRKKWMTCRKWAKWEIVGKEIEKIRRKKEMIGLFYLTHLEFFVCFCHWRIKLGTFYINIFPGSVESQKSRYPRLCFHTWLTRAGGRALFPRWDGIGALWFSTWPTNDVPSNLGRRLLIQGVFTPW